jgi:hypothetical protein
VARRINMWFQQAQTFLAFRGEQKRYSQLASDAKDWLKPYLKEHGTEDPEHGHMSVDFPEPVVIDGTKYTGLVLRKNVTKNLLVDDALDLLESKDLLNRVRKLRPAEYYYDWDELDVLVQEGQISEAEFDALTDEDVTWALWSKEE